MKSPLGRHLFSFQSELCQPLGIMPARPNAPLPPLSTGLILRKQKDVGSWLEFAYIPRVPNVSTE
jgi:hypothetical protein